MSKMTDIINDLELAAKKLKMTVEEAVDVLLGVHPTHTVVQAHATEAQKEEAKAEIAAKVDTPEASTPASNAPTVVSTVGTTGSATTTTSTSVETTTTTEPGAAA